MTQVFRLEFHNLQLTVDGKSYLVEVKETPENNARTARFSDIPEWVFGSKHAIWLSDSGKNVTERARKGDEIKSQILAILRSKH